MFFFREEGDVKKEGEQEEKEQEKLGRLEFSLDYNFTDAQVGPVWKQSFQFQVWNDLYIDSTNNYHSDPFCLSSVAHSGHPSGSGPCCYGYGGNLRPLRQSVFAARQKEEVRDQSSAQELMPSIQRDFHLQGTTCLTLCLCWLDVCLLVCSFSLCLSFCLWSRLWWHIIVYPLWGRSWPVSLRPLVFSPSFPEWRMSRYPCPQKISKQHVFNCLHCVDMHMLSYGSRTVYFIPLRNIHPNAVLNSLCRSHMQSWAERLWFCKFSTLTVSQSMTWSVR